MSLLTALPNPLKNVNEVEEYIEREDLDVAVPQEPPPYLRRKNFIPRKQEDFYDGGAFPEIHIPQYPLGMGEESESHRRSKTLDLTVNDKGEINFDAIVKQGKNKSKIVYSKHEDILPKIDQLSTVEKNEDEEEIKEVANATWERLQRVVDMKIQAEKPKTIGPRPAKPQFIKYTPSQQTSASNATRQRIIKMQDMPVDPLEPAKFRHMKVPRNSGDPPVPILHSPPRPVSKQDQLDWKIPPCISNWKNPKGYTIPLDKRLASDGRGLQETTVSDKFAAFSESLYTAEHKARDALHMRNKMQRELLTREKEKKEKELRELAQRARMEHGGLSISDRIEASNKAAETISPENREERSEYNHREQRNPNSRKSSNTIKESKEERIERLKRDEIREERRRERERERRLEAKDAKLGKKSKITRDRDRDVTEKVALGMASVNTQTGEAMYDAKLFNQDKGMAPGFGEDDGYNIYDKPLFIDKGSNLYKPSRLKDNDLYGDSREKEAIETSKFKADTGFKGTEEPAEGIERTGPVQFESDPFGLEGFVDDVKTKEGGNVLEKLGKRGGMNAAAGASSYEFLASGTSRRRIEFD